MADHVFDSPEAREEFRVLMQDPTAREAFLRLKSESEDAGLRRRYSHVLQLVGEAVWAMREKEFRVVCDILSLRAAGGRFNAEELEQRIGAARNEPDQVSREGGVAVLPIHGTIVPRADAFTEMSGGSSVESLRAMFRAALADPAVGSIVFDIDSPGGMADQIPEFADEIFKARGQKPMIAIANTLCASAAYWIATQADEVVVSKSGQVGSIGCITIHEEYSKMDEMAGVKSTVITAGKYKGEGNPYEPLTEEAQAYMQSRVDAFSDMFVKGVARGRGTGTNTVRGADFGQGRMKMAREAVASGMADRITTLDEVIAGALRRGRSSSAAAALVDAGAVAAAATDALVGAVQAGARVEDPAADEPLPEPTDELDRIDRALEPAQPPQPDPAEAPVVDDPEVDEPAEEISDSADAPESPEPANPAEDPEGLAANENLRAELQVLSMTE